jgi:hypothetical protein
VSYVIGLEVVDERRQYHALQAVAVYGSRGSPRTLRTIRPGEAVELIVPGKWEFQSEAGAGSILGSLPRDVDVVARLAFAHQPQGHWYAPAASANAIAVHLNAPRVRGK